LLATERLKVIAAVHPGLWHPGVLAKLGATADHLSRGRFAVNVVSGWFKAEFTGAAIIRRLLGCWALWRHRDGCS
jgi:FMNH2-dependent dimethyl sulfone monooxygenase